MPEDDTDQPRTSSAPDSDAPPVQPAPDAQQPQGMYAANLTPDGLAIEMQLPPTGFLLGEQVMDDLCRRWLAAHPALFDALIQERMDALVKAKEGLQIVRDPATIRKIAKSKQGLQA